MSEDKLWVSTLLNHIRTLEGIYGHLNVEENKEKLLKEKGLDDIIYFFYVNAIDTYLENLSEEEKKERGMNG